MDLIVKKVKAGNTISLSKHDTEERYQQRAGTQQQNNLQEEAQTLKTLNLKIFSRQQTLFKNVFCSSSSLKIHEIN